MKELSHPDGIWKTSEHAHNDRKILIKSRKGKGIKCHVFLPNSEEVDFTLRFDFMLPNVLLEKAKNKINLRDQQ